MPIGDALPEALAGLVAKATLAGHPPPPDVLAQIRELGE